jgi:hypothetical protein
MARDLNVDILSQSFVLRGLPRHELEHLAGWAAVDAHQVPYWGRGNLDSTEYGFIPQA